MKRSEQLGQLMLTVSVILFKNNRYIKTLMANSTCSNGDLIRPLFL